MCASKWHLSLSTAKILYCMFHRENEDIDLALQFHGT